MNKSTALHNSRGSSCEGSNEDENNESRLLEEKLRSLLNRKDRPLNRPRNVFNSVDYQPIKPRKSVVDRARQKLCSSTPMPTRGKGPFALAESELSEISPIPLSPPKESVSEHHPKVEIKKGVGTAPPTENENEPLAQNLPGKKKTLASKLPKAVYNTRSRGKLERDTNEVSSTVLLGDNKNVSNVNSAPAPRKLRPDRGVGTPSRKIVPDLCTCEKEKQDSNHNIVEKSRRGVELKKTPSVSTEKYTRVDRSCKKNTPKPNKESGVCYVTKRRNEKPNSDQDSSAGDEEPVKSGGLKKISQKKLVFSETSDGSDTEPNNGDVGKIVNDLRTSSESISGNKNSTPGKRDAAVPHRNVAEKGTSPLAPRTEDTAKKTEIANANKIMIDAGTSPFNLRGVSNRTPALEKTLRLVPPGVGRVTPNGLAKRTNIRKREEISANVTAAPSTSKEEISLQKVKKLDQLIMSISRKNLKTSQSTQFNGSPRNVSFEIDSNTHSRFNKGSQTSPTPSRFGKSANRPRENHSTKNICTQTVVEAPATHNRSVSSRCSSVTDNSEILREYDRNCRLFESAIHMPAIKYFTTSDEDDEFSDTLMSSNGIPWRVNEDLIPQNLHRKSSVKLNFLKSEQELNGSKLSSTSSEEGEQETTIRTRKKYYQNKRRKFYLSTVADGRKKIETPARKSITNGTVSTNTNHLGNEENGRVDGTENSPEPKNGELVKKLARRYHKFSSTEISSNSEDEMRQNSLKSTEALDCVTTGKLLENKAGAPPIQSASEPHEQKNSTQQLNTLECIEINSSSEDKTQQNSLKAVNAMDSVIAAKPLQNNDEPTSQPARRRKQRDSTEQLNASKYKEIGSNSKEDVPRKSLKIVNAVDGVTTGNSSANQSDQRTSECEIRRSKEKNIADQLSASEGKEINSQPEEGNCGKDKMRQNCLKIADSMDCVTPGKSLRNKNDEPRSRSQHKPNKEKNNPKYTEIGGNSDEENCGNGKVGQNSSKIADSMDYVTPRKSLQNKNDEPRSRSQHKRDKEKNYPKYTEIGGHSEEENCGNGEMGQNSLKAVNVTTSVTAGNVEPTSEPKNTSVQLSTPKHTKTGSSSEKEIRGGNRRRQKSLEAVAAGNHVTAENFLEDIRVELTSKSMGRGNKKTRLSTPKPAQISSSSDDNHEENLKRRNSTTTSKVVNGISAEATQNEASCLGIEQSNHDSNQAEVREGTNNSPRDNQQSKRKGLIIHHSQVINPEVPTITKEPQAEVAEIDGAENHVASEKSNVEISPRNKSPPPVDNAGSKNQRPNPYIVYEDLAVPLAESDFSQCTASETSTAPTRIEIIAEVHVTPKNLLRRSSRKPSNVKKNLRDQSLNGAAGPTSDEDRNVSADRLRSTEIQTASKSSKVESTKSRGSRSRKSPRNSSQSVEATPQTANSVNAEDGVRPANPTFKVPKARERKPKPKIVVEDATPMQNCEEQGVRRSGRERRQASRRCIATLEVNNERELHRWISANDDYGGSSKAKKRSTKSTAKRGRPSKRSEIVKETKKPSQHAETIDPGTGTPERDIYVDSQEMEQHFGNRDITITTPRKRLYASGSSKSSSTKESLDENEVKKPRKNTKPIKKTDCTAEKEDETIVDSADPPGDDFNTASDDASSSRKSKLLSGRVKKEYKKKSTFLLNNVSKILSTTRELVVDVTEANIEDLTRSNISDARSKRLTLLQESTTESEYINVPIDDEIVRIKYVDRHPEFELIQDDLLLAKCVRNSKMGCLKIPPGKRKPLHLAKKFSMDYMVVEGKGFIQIENSTSQVEKFSNFYVPLGAYYSIINLSNEIPLILIFGKSLPPAKL